MKPVNHLLRKAVAVMSVALSLTAVQVHAKELNLGMLTPITSLDPHFFNSASNNNMSRHVFETLIKLGADMQLQPGLATEWKVVEKNVWEVKLRSNVKWHDGSSFTADDVVFTVQRAPNVPNSPSSFATITSEIKEVKAIDPLTVRITTHAPAPLLPNNLSALPIISKKAGDKATTEDYNSGKATVGTGPYKLSEYLPNNRVVLVRNDSYWAGAEPWEKVTFKFLPVAATRVAALLSGGVDFIEGVPPADARRISSEPNLRLVSGISNRLIYLHMDSNRDQSPFVTDQNGKPLEKNPLKDARVRKAISLAVNRPAIVDSLLEGRATQAEQFMPKGSFGNSKTLRPDAYDLAGAKKMLAESGYPNGFHMVIHSPLNRYVNDGAVAQVLAQLLARVGIVTRVETMPAAVYFSRANKLEFSVMLSSWGGADTQEALMAVRPVVATFDKDKGAGSANRGRYSNPQLDQLIEQGMGATNRNERADLSARVVEMAIKDTAIVPLYFEHSTWAMKKGFQFKPRIDAYTMAMEIR